MEAIPRDYGRGQFDAFCKKVLKNEARAYLRNMKRQRDRETMFSDLPQHELDKLCTVDECTRFIYPYFHPQAFLLYALEWQPRPPQYPLRAGGSHWRFER